MQTLFGWIISSRLAAAIWVLFCIGTSYWVNINALIGAAALALVWLRKGDTEGLITAAWAFIPAACLAYQFHSYFALLLIVSVCIGSALLRLTRSWANTLVALAITCVTLSAGLLLLEGSYSHYIAGYDYFLTQLRQQAAQNTELLKNLPAAITAVDVAKLVGAILLSTSFLSVLIGRFYQAKLFNPGGFKAEFHQLRLSKLQSIACVLLFALCLSQQNLQGWVWAPMFPLLISGIGLFHYFAGTKQLATPLYVLFYILIIVLDPFKFMMATFAVLDSLTSIRQKLKPSSKE